MKRILFTGKEQAILASEVKNETSSYPLISGKTQFTLISTGTELARYQGASGFPNAPGYAAVFKKEGTEELYFCEGKHQEYQMKPKDQVIQLPEDLDPKLALFARILKTFYNALESTYLEGKTVQVTGRGLVAHIFRRLLTYINIKIVKENADIMLECEGKGENIYNARKDSTVYLIGVPWRNNPIYPANDILRYVFYNRIIIKSGWETDRFDYTYLMLLFAKEAQIGDIYDIAKPENCQEVYQTLLHNRKKLTTIFDWR